MHSTQIRLQEDPTCSRLQTVVQEIAAELAQFEAWRLEGQQIRSRVKWRQKGDAGTKEFYSAVQRKTMYASITKLVNEEEASCFEQE